MELANIFPDGTKIGVNIEFIMKNGKLEKNKAYTYIGGFKMSKKDKLKQKERETPPVKRNEPLEKF